MGPDGVMGCADLAGIGLLDADGCCVICHSADAYSMTPAIGPCRVTLPESGEAFVCCSGKRSLLQDHDPAYRTLRTLPDQRRVGV